MTMNMNFDITSFNSSDLVAKKSTRLAGDKIHEVKIKDVELITKETGVAYVKITFEDKEGLTFDDMIFKPSDLDRYVKRQDGTYGPNPSDAEKVALKCFIYISNFAPKAFKDVQDGKLKIGNVCSWEGIQRVAKLLKDYGIKEQQWCKLKLLKDKKGYASLPYFARLSKNGEDYKPSVSNNFLVNVNIPEVEIAFTKKELEAIESRSMPQQPKSDNSFGGGSELLTGETSLGLGSESSLSDLDGLEL